MYETRKTVACGVTLKSEPSDSAVPSESAADAARTACAIGGTHITTKENVEGEARAP